MVGRVRRLLRRRSRSGKTRRGKSEAVGYWRVDVIGFLVILEVC